MCAVLLCCTHSRPQTDTAAVCALSGAYPKKAPVKAEPGLLVVWAITQAYATMHAHTTRAPSSSTAILGGTFVHLLQRYHRLRQFFINFYVCDASVFSLTQSVIERARQSGTVSPWHTHIQPIPWPFDRGLPWKYCMSICPCCKFQYCRSASITGLRFAPRVYYVHKCVRCLQASVCTTLFSPSFYNHELVVALLPLLFMCGMFFGLSFPLSQKQACCMYVICLIVFSIVFSQSV